MASQPAGGVDRLPPGLQGLQPGDQVRADDAGIGSDSPDHHRSARRPAPAGSGRTSARRGPWRRRTRTGGRRLDRPDGWRPGGSRRRRSWTRNGQLVLNRCSAPPPSGPPPGQWQARHPAPPLRRPSAALAPCAPGTTVATPSGRSAPALVRGEAALTISSWVNPVPHAPAVSRLAQAAATSGMSRRCISAPLDRPVDIL